MIKRWISAALALLLILMPALGEFDPVFAEDDEEVYAELVEEEVGLAGDSDSEELALFIDDWEIDEAADLSTEEAFDAAPDDTPDIDDDAYDDPLSVDSVVIVTEGEEAYGTQDGDAVPAEGEGDDPLPEGGDDPSGGLFSLSEDSKEVVVGGSYTLEAVETDGGEAIDPEELSFESSDPEIATVDDQGVVTAVQPGSTSITVTYQDAVCRSAVTVPQEPDDISLNYSTGSIGLSETCATLQVSMIPSNSNASVAWRSSNSKYVKVVKSDGGKVTIKGVKTGSAYIYAKTRNGIEKKCKVTVKKAPKSISITKSLTVGVNQTRKTSYSLSSGSASAGITWKSSNPEVASVDPATGKVTGHHPGKVTITAKTYNKKTSNKCTVTVKGEPTGIFVRETAIVAKGYRKTLKPSVEPAGAMEYYRFSSSDESTAKVDASTGAITGVKLGTVTITVKTYNGLAASCEVTVMKAPSKIALNKTGKTLSIGNTYQLTPTLTPADADPRIKWSSSNSAVASVSNGLVTAKKLGSATITSVTSNGKKATCKIYVTPAPKSVSIAPGAVTLGGGGMHFTLIQSVNPSNTRPACVYETSDESVVEIEGVSSGKISIITHNAGTAVITATAYNGMAGACTVTVLPPPETARFSTGSIQLSVYQKVTPEVTVLTASGAQTYANLTFSVLSADPAGCVTVDRTTGKITGKKDGQATIGVTTHNGVTAAPLTVTVDNSAIIEAVIAKAKSVLGKPYVYGGGYQTASPKGFDCSGLTYWAYYYGTGKKVKLGSSAYKQGNDANYANKRVTGWKNCVRGDILCFRSDSSSTISHVGLYLGSGKFIHASSSGKKVQYGYFNSGNSADYWKRNLKWGYHVF